MKIFKNFLVIILIYVAFQYSTDYFVAFLLGLHQPRLSTCFLSHPSKLLKVSLI